MQVTRCKGRGHIYRPYRPTACLVMIWWWCWMMALLCRRDSSIWTLATRGSARAANWCGTTWGTACRERRWCWWPRTVPSCWPRPTAPSQTLKLPPTIKSNTALSSLDRHSMIYLLPVSASSPPTRTSTIDIVRPGPRGITLGICWREIFIRRKSFPNHMQAVSQRWRQLIWINQKMWFLTY